IAFFAVLVVPPMVREIQQLARDIPGYIDRLQRGHARGFVADLERKYHLAERLKEATSRIPSLASSSFGTILGITKSIASVIFKALTIGILTIYFLMALPRGEETAKTLVAGEHTIRNIRILNEALERIGGYVSGNLFISVIAGILPFGAMRIISGRIGRSLAGLAGGLLALPIDAAIKVGIREVWFRGRIAHPTATQASGAIDVSPDSSALPPA